MNKATKGALAAGAAVVLLLGGAGSYALWSDDATLPGGGTIATGELNLEPVGTGVWTDVSPAAPTTGGNIDINTFVLVPGDVLSYDATFRVDADGDNLQATLIPDATSIAYSAGLSAAEVTVALTTQLDGVAVPPLVTEDNDGDVLAVKVLVTFNPATIDQVGQNESVGLQDFRVVLQQTRG